MTPSGPVTTRRKSPQTLAEATSVRRKFMFWGSIFLVTIGLVWLFSPILAPFVFGAIIAYLLDPVATFLQRRGMSRLTATLLILVSFVTVVAGACVLLLPSLVDQGVRLTASAPIYVERLQDIADMARQRYLASGFAGDATQLREVVGDAMKSGSAIFSRIAVSVWQSWTNLLGLVSLFVLTPVVSFYLLLDWQRMIATGRELVPSRNRPVVDRIAKDMDRSIAGFIRGQTGVCLILAVYYAAGLSLTGLNYGLLIGIFVGLISFIPYVGSVTGLLAAMGIAFSQFWPEWTWIAVVGGVFVVGQFLEANILQPKLVGGSIGVHPVWLMFALLASSALFGFIGLLMSVPLAAAAAVLIRFALGRYRESTFYVSPTLIRDGRDERPTLIL